MYNFHFQVRLLGTKPLNLSHQDIYKYKIIKLQTQGPVKQPEPADKPAKPTKGKVRKSNAKLKQYECDQCDQTFYTLMGRNKHKREFHRPPRTEKKKDKNPDEATFKNPHTCDTCGKQFTNRSAYRTHQTVHAVRQYLCNECGKLFKDSAAMNRHIRAVHMGDRRHACQQCPRRFITRSLLVQHIRVHTGERPNLCTQCGRAFRTTTGLRVHEQRHRGDRPYKCDQCDRRFTTRSNLRGHQQGVHERLKRRKSRRAFNAAGETNVMRCDIPGCKEVLTSARALERHYAEHSHQYRCPLCQQSFRQEKIRDIHLLRQHATDVTSGEYSCPVCNDRYELLSDLVEHESTHDERQYICDECQQTFGSEYTFMLHVDRVHKLRPFTCDECGKSFTQTSGLFIHKKLHTGERKYACEHCQRTFTQQQQLMYHVRVHTGEKPHICPICKKGFALNGNLTVHLRRHTGDKPYTCDQCGKAFYDSSHLRKHQRAQHPTSGD